MSKIKSPTICGAFGTFKILLLCEIGLYAVKTTLVAFLEICIFDTC